MAVIALAVAVGVGVGAVVTSLAARANIPSPSESDTNRGVDLQRKLDPDYPREIAVGKFATGGSGVYDTVSDAGNKYLWRCTCISDYEITAFTELWIDGELATLSGDALAGWVNVTNIRLKEDNTPTIRIRVMPGTETQTLDSELAAAAGPGSIGGELTAADKFTGGRGYRPGRAGRRRKPDLRAGPYGLCRGGGAGSRSERCGQRR